MSLHKRITILLSAIACLSILFVNISPLEGYAANRTVSMDSCFLSGSDVICSLRAASIPQSDDGTYYIYANEVYQDGTAGQIVATVDADTSVSVSFPLHYGTSSSNLSKKFLVAVKSGGQMIQVSNEHYITNPESIAAYTSPRMTAGIKGILPGTMINDGTLQDLGIQQVAYNINLGDLCSDASVPGSILFSYNGTDYYFDQTAVSSYDSVIKYLNALGIQVSLVILNTGEGAYGKQLIHPLSLEGDCPGYALNVANETGVNCLKAIGAFLGQRYSGTRGYGQVDNWILGNETNARTSWWYSSSASLDLNVNMYAKAFRIFYNELKSNNANARIYNSIDQEWNRKSNPGSFLAKDYLDQFNYYMTREGNIDWGLSYHPYNSPLYDPYAWNGPSMWVKKSISTPYITMQNIDVLIDYMNQPAFLNPAGEVRSISLAEIGYTSSFGTEKQEASVAYGYLKAASLPDVDAFILYRQMDHPHEMASYLALGLEDMEGNPKAAYHIYKNLGTENEAAAKARASEIIGMDIDTMIRENIVWTRTGDGVVHD